MSGQDTLQAGRFVVLGLLGEGTQGQTFDAVDKREGVPVAVKRFDIRNARSWKDAELAEREARVLQSFSHPNLPRYVAHFEENGALYLVMEKITGESVASMRRRGVNFSEDDAIRFLTDTSNVLDYIHGRNPPVIHRDIKPGNVLRRPDGSFVLVDFGAVREKLRPEGGSTIVGTFGYMAPEQFQGRALPTSDVYAAGATVVAMLTGREPEHLPHQGLALDVRRALGSRVSAGLIHVLERMLDPDPDRRAGRIGSLLPSLQARTAHSESARANRSVDNPGRGRRDSSADRVARVLDEFERRAREYERRAEAGGPGAHGWRRGAEKTRAAALRYREAQERRTERRNARRVRRRERGWSPPWPIALFLRLGLVIGTITVLLATQVLVPMILRLLSLILRRPALDAASFKVRQRGREAARSMKQARIRVAASDGDQPQGDPRIRVQPVSERLPDESPAAADDATDIARTSANRRS